MKVIMFLFVCFIWNLDNKMGRSNVKRVASNSWLYQPVEFQIGFKKKNGDHVIFKFISHHKARVSAFENSKVFESFGKF